MKNFKDLINGFSETNPDIVKGLEQNAEADVLRRMLKEQREFIYKLREQEKERVEKFLNFITEMESRPRAMWIIKRDPKKFIKQVRTKFKEIFKSEE